MRSYIRKPSIKKSVSARTTGRVKKTVKKAVNPLYGKKGMGYINNPQKALYNNIYNKTSKSIYDVSSSNRGYSKSGNSLLNMYMNQANQYAEKVASEMILGILLFVMGGFFLGIGYLLGKIFDMGIFTFVGLLLVSGAILTFLLAHSNKKNEKECNERALKIMYEEEEKSNIRHSYISHSTFKRTDVSETVRNSFSNNLIIGKNGNNNMNCKMYIFSAKYIATGRMHKNHIIYVFGNQSIREEIISKGYEEPIEYEERDFSTPSDAQISYMQDLGLNNQPTKLCSEDATGILTKHLENDEYADRSMYRFTEEMHIPMSYYMPTRRLYNTVFNMLQPRDKRAYFAFSVFRLNKKENNANMNESPHRAIFYEFADFIENDDSFIKSLEKIEGSRLLFMGTRTRNGETYNGLNKTSIAYKKTYEFLHSKSLI